RCSSGCSSRTRVATAAGPAPPRPPPRAPPTARTDATDALPARWYCDPATVALERGTVFDRGWHLLAHASRLRGPGDHVVADCAGLPVIAVRGGDEDGGPGPIRAFHSVCRHRAGPIAQCDGLAAKSLRCRYHGWTYG